MKKVFLAIIGICMIVGYSACGSSEKNTDKESAPNERVQNVEEREKETESVETESTQEAEEEGVTYKPKQEILDAKHDSGLIQVNDQLIKLPIYLSELIAMGFDYDLDNGSRQKDYRFAANDNICMNLILGEDIFFAMNESNPSEEDGLTIEEIDPLIKNIQVAANAKNIIYYPGGVIIGGSAQTMHDNLGEPFEVATDAYGRTVYTYGDYSTEGMMVYVIEESQTVSLMNIRKTEEYVFNKVENFAPVTFENIQNTQDLTVWHNITMLYAPDYVVPSNKPVQEWNAYVEADNEKFLMSFSCVTTLQKYYNPMKHNFHGEALYEETDENGVIRRLYFAESCYMIECVTDEYVFDGYITFENRTNHDIDPYEKFKNLAIDIAASVEIS